MRNFTTQEDSNAIPLERGLLRAASSKWPILITGATGSGKSRLARSIHLASGRPAHLIFFQGCGEVPPELLHGHLFGHVAGAFTDARQSCDGVLRRHDGGTVVLEDIDALAPRQQTALLNYLDTGLVTRLGDDKGAKAVDARIIATTNVDVPRALESGRLRSDLFYRLAECSLHVPPLRSRALEIPSLIRRLETEVAAEFDDGFGTRPLHDDVLALFARDAWPGNFRELRGQIRRLLMFCDIDRTGPITLQELLELEERRPVSQSPLARLQDAARDDDVVLQVLRITRGNRSLSARLLGISRETIHKKIRRYDWRV